MQTFGNNSHKPHGPHDKAATTALKQCLSTGCIVHPKVCQNFSGVYDRGGVYRGVPDV